MHTTPHHPSHSSFRQPYRRWDGSRVTTARPSRPLRITRGTGTGLLRCGQIGRCRECGNPVEWYYRPDHRMVPLHPRELPAHAVPEAHRWHVASGIAYAAGDGSAWCRLPHDALCPASTPTTVLPHLAALRRRLAARTRHLTDTGAFTPRDEPGSNGSCRPARPVVQILGARYLAARPVEDIRCLARARSTRARCTQPVKAPSRPAGTWRLLPATATTGQLALPAGLLMAVYDLSDLPDGEQLRWYAQRCPHHTTAVAEMATCEWDPFDPLLHRDHMHPRLPGQTRPPRPAGPCTAAHT